MKYEILIVADTNDGDYVTGINVIDEKQLEKLKPIIQAIKKKNGRYEFGELSSLGWENPTDQFDFSEEQFELLHEFLPTGEYGVHTIESVDIYPVPKKQRLL